MSTIKSLRKFTAIEFSSLSVDRPQAHILLTFSFYFVRGERILHLIGFMYVSTQNARIFVILLAAVFFFFTN